MPARAKEEGSTFDGLDDDDDDRLVSKRRSPATIADVARKAGVSTATVSRVVSGVGNPRPATVARVKKAVEELDYRPSAVARSLRMHRTRTLGLVVTDIQDPFFPELVQAADLAARSLGYSILLGSAAYDEQRAMHYLDLMADRRVDGILVASSQVSMSRKWLASSPVPIIIVNAEMRDPPVTIVTSDNQGGSALAAAHMLELGHRRIAYVEGPTSYSAGQPRLRGFRKAVRDAGLAATETPELPGDGQVEGGERAVATLMARDPDVTALVCYNDLTAMGALRALRAAGRRVPADISVIGLDDIAAAASVVPALTTVAQQKARMGQLSTDLLIRAIEHPDDVYRPEIVRLPMAIVERESTGPVTKAARCSPPTHW